MEIRFFGTRGSIATPGPSTVRYGGNTSCVALRSKAGTQIILDIGTGATVLGRTMLAEGTAKRGHILISHTHWDHIQGLPFFVPLFMPGNEWDIYAPRGLMQSLRETLAGQMQYNYFPVSLDALGATIRYHDLVEGGLTIDDVEVTARYLNHPALTLGYRLVADGVTVVYSCDHEPYMHSLAVEPDAAGTTIEGEDSRHVDFLRGADLVIHDAQYLASEFDKKIGWGHSTVEYAVAMARVAGVRRLALTHHDPMRDDAAIDQVLEVLRATAAKYPGSPEIIGASEGLTIALEAQPTAAPAPADEFPAEVEVASARAGGPVLLVLENAERRAMFTEILATDQIPAITVTFDQVGAFAARDLPSLVLIEDTHDDRPAAAAAAVHEATRHGEMPPIVLVTDQPAARDAPPPDGFAARLVEPISPSYARTWLRAWTLRAACRWVRAPLPDDEERRLAAIADLHILDTPAEERFDRITRLAAALLDVPVALISMVDRDRQWFKSTCGLEARESPRDTSFCAHAVFERKPLIVPDALLDDRFADNPFVAGPPHLRFYAGQPLVLPDGSCIGTLCLADTRPRDLDARDLIRLADLAQLVLRELELGPVPA